MALYVRDGVQCSMFFSLLWISVPITQMGLWIASDYFITSTIEELIMDPLKLRRLLVLLILGLVGAAAAAGCGFPAVYNFGDSNSDTGGISAALNEIQPPNGETFFGRPSGRACDGRLVIDFIGKLPKFLISVCLWRL